MPTRWPPNLPSLEPQAGGREAPIIDSLPWALMYHGLCLPFSCLFLCLSWALLSSWCLHFPETLHCPTLCSAYILPAPIPALTLIAVVFWATLLSQAQDLSSPLSCSLLQQALDCRSSISYLTLVVCPTWLLGLSLNSQQCPSTAVPWSWGT